MSKRANIDESQLSHTKWNCQYHIVFIKKKSFGKHFLIYIYIYWEMIFMITELEKTKIKYFMSNDVAFKIFFRKNPKMLKEVISMSLRVDENEKKI